MAKGDKFEAPYYSSYLASQVLRINKGIEVQIVDDSEMPVKNLSSMYVSGSWMIRFSHQWIASHNILEVFHATFHEVRHAYQETQILYKDAKVKAYHYEEPERIERWRKEFDNYIRPEGNNNPLEDSDYLNLEIEIDAFAFANFLLNRLMDVESEVPEPIRDKVKVRQKEIAKQFENDEIFTDNKKTK